MKEEQRVERYAVIETGGKQYLVCKGDSFDIEKIDSKENEKISFEKVLLVKDKEELLLGFPLLQDWIVKAQVVRQFRGEKIRVAKFKAKSRYRRVKGHRQSLTKIQILEIAKVKKTLKPQPKKTETNKKVTVKKKIDTREK